MNRVTKERINLNPCEFGDYSSRPSSSRGIVQYPPSHHFTVGRHSADMSKPATTKKKLKKNRSMLSGHSSYSNNEVFSMTKSTLSINSVSLHNAAVRETTPHNAKGGVITYSDENCAHSQSSPSLLPNIQQPRHAPEPMNRLLGCGRSGVTQKPSNVKASKLLRKLSSFTSQDSGDDEIREITCTNNDDEDSPTKDTSTRKLFRKLSSSGHVDDSCKEEEEMPRHSPARKLLQRLSMRRSHTFTNSNSNSNPPNPAITPERFTGSVLRSSSAVGVRSDPEVENATLPPPHSHSHSHGEGPGTKRLLHKLASFSRSTDDSDEDINMKENSTSPPMKVHSSQHNSLQHRKSPRIPDKSTSRRLLQKISSFSRDDDDEKDKEDDLFSRMSPRREQTLSVSELKEKGLRPQSPDKATSKRLLHKLASFTSTDSTEQDENEPIIHVCAALSNTCVVSPLAPNRYKDHSDHEGQAIQHSKKSAWRSHRSQSASVLRRQGSKEKIARNSWVSGGDSAYPNAPHREQTRIIEHDQEEVTGAPPGGSPIPLRRRSSLVRIVPRNVSQTEYNSLETTKYLQQLEAEDDEDVMAEVERSSHLLSEAARLHS